MARKTYKKKSSAKRAARKRGGSAYKVKGGWRVSSKRRFRRKNGWYRMGGRRH
jgi:hypothetical protein